MQKNEWRDLARAFEEASSISIGLVIFPVILLLLGVAIDKALSTTPLFIFAGIVGGVALGIYRSIKISKNYKLKNKKEDKNG